MRVYFVLALALALVGCENDVDTSPNYLPGGAQPDTTGEGGDAFEFDGVATGETGSDATEGGGTATGGACDSCLSEGVWYRFTKLEVIKLGGFTAEPPSPVPVLNDIWSGDIEGIELNILLNAATVMDSNIDVTVAVGARIPEQTGAYCRLGANYEDNILLERTGCELSSLDSGLFAIYAGTVGSPKNCSTLTPPNAINVGGIEMSGTVSADCKKIEGTLNGWIPEAVLDAVCSCITADSTQCGYDPSFVLPPGKLSGCSGCGEKYSPLSGLLKTFAPGGVIATDCADADGNPTICIEAAFAVELVDAPPSCE
jgi:hypothetical protein